MVATATSKMHVDYRKMTERDKVKTSLTQAFDELHSGKAMHNARSLFKK